MLKRSRGTRVLAAVAGWLLLSTGCASHAGPRAAPPVGANSVHAVSPEQEARRQVELGNQLLAEGRLDDAEHAFRLALEAQSSSIEAASGLGRVEVQRGHYTEALPLLERATRASGQMVSTFRALGDAYAATGDFERAAVSYRQAVALAPEDVEGRLLLGRMLTEAGDLNEAEEVLTRALRMTREDSKQLAHAHAELGEVYCRQGKSPEAMASFYKAAELNPGDLEITRGLAACAVRAGLYAEAASAYQKVLQIEPLDLSAKKQLAWVNFKLERFPNAIGHYEAIRDSLGTVDRYYLAQAYAKTNKVDRAVEQFREVIRLDRQNYKGVYCNMAYAYYDANRYESAIRVAKEGLQADSTSACLHFCWAQALDKLGRHEDAILAFEAVGGTDPAYADAAKRELERQRRIVRLLRSK